MSIENFELNKNYEIYLSKIYGNSRFNVQIIGTTNIDAVSKNQEDFNIFNYFFEPLGLGLGSYLSAVNKETVIFICNIITSLTPFELSDEKIFIPETLIDKDKSQEYIKSYIISYSINKIIKHDITNEELTKYVKEQKDKITEKLNSLIDFNVSSIRITDNIKETFLTKDSLKKLDYEKETLYKNYLDRLKESAIKENEKNEMYYNLIKEMEEQKYKYKQQEEEYRLKNIELQKLIDEYEKWHASTVN